MGGLLCVCMYVNVCTYIHTLTFYTNCIRMIQAGKQSNTYKKKKSKRCFPFSRLVLFLFIYIFNVYKLSLSLSVSHVLRCHVLYMFVKHIYIIMEEE